MEQKQGDDDRQRKMKEDDDDDGNVAVDDEKEDEYKTKGIRESESASKSKLSAMTPAFEPSGRPQWIPQSQPHRPFQFRSGLNVQNIVLHQPNGHFVNSMYQ